MVGGTRRYDVLVIINLILETSHSRFISDVFSTKKDIIWSSSTSMNMTRPVPESFNSFLVPLWRQGAYGLSWIPRIFLPDVHY